MSQVLYDANPSLVRSKPFGTLLALLMVFGGIAIALFGRELLPAGPVDLPADLPVGAVGIGLFGLGFLMLLSWFVAAKMDRLQIKENEIVWTHGLISKQYTEISMTSVRTVRVNQSILQRLLGAGDLAIYTAGDRPEMVIKGLPEPTRIRDLIKG